MFSLYISMKHLKIGFNTLNIIPREYNDGDVTVQLISESTGVNVEQIVDAQTVGNYMQITVYYDELTEGDFYILNVLYNGNIIYKDKVFSTSQEINQSNNDYYTINKDEYIQDNNGNNDFIFI